MQANCSSIYIYIYYIYIFILVKALACLFSGLESALISMPVNFLIVSLFRASRPIPFQCRKQKQERYLPMIHYPENCTYLQTAGNVESDNKAKQEGKIAEVRLHNSYFYIKEIQKKRVKIFLLCAFVFLLTNQNYIFGIQKFIAGFITHS